MSERNIFAVCDLDVDYAYHFMEYLSKKKNIPFEVRVFTSAAGFQEYVKEHPVELRFIEMMPIGMGKACQGKSRDELLELLEKAFGNAEPYEKHLGNGPAEYVSFSGFQSRIGFISAVSHKFCDSCNRIRLTAEGYLKLCLQYESGIDLRKLLRSGATDEEVKEAMRQAIWKKPACHNFSDERRDEEVGQKKEHRAMYGIGG